MTARARGSCQSLRRQGLAVGTVVSLLAAMAGPGQAGEVSATHGALGLGTRVNGVVGGGCNDGGCSVSGGTSAGHNLFHRFNRFDTRGNISGVSIENGTHRLVVVGVLDPLGSFLNKTIRLEAPARLLFLSPGGIRLGSGVSFTNVPQLTLSTASSAAIGAGRFDVFGTTASQAALLSGDLPPGRTGLTRDAAELAANGITNEGDLVVEGGLITVENELLLDAQGGHVLVQGGELHSPGGSLELAGHNVQTSPNARLDVAAPSHVSDRVDGGSLRVAAQENTTVSGTLAATGGGGFGQGGRIEISGTHVSLESAHLDASGPGGGGTVLIGGDVRGGNPSAVPNALTTTVDAASTVKADALANGPGGSVVLWSEEKSVMGGKASARGGPFGGDGGTLEVSSSGQLEYAGRLDAGAAEGKPGLIIFDPKDIIIQEDIRPLLTTRVTAHGNATNDSSTGIATLTQNERYQSGGIFFDLDQPIDALTSFSSRFTFAISQATTGQGADGLVFVIKNKNASTLGGVGGNMGYGSSSGTEISNSIGIEFDSYYNGDSGDGRTPNLPRADHIGFNKNGSIVSAIATPVLEGGKAVELDNNRDWYARVGYSGADKKFTVELASNPDLASPIKLDYTLPTSEDLTSITSPNISLGLTAATGLITSQHTVKDWTISLGQGPTGTSFGDNPSTTLNLKPSDIRAIAATGSNVTLEANNDIKVLAGNPVIIDASGNDGFNLSLRAGRSIEVHSEIRIDGGLGLNLEANASQAIRKYRDSGEGNIVITAPLTSSGFVDLRINNDPGVGEAGKIDISNKVTGSDVHLQASPGINLHPGAQIQSTRNGGLISLVSTDGPIHNYVGPDILSFSEGGEWSIYTKRPEGNLLGGLAFDFKQYGFTYGATTTPVPLSGNGLFYEISPRITVALKDVAKVYDGTAKAEITAANTQVIGAIDGDILEAAVSNTAYISAGESPVAGGEPKDVGVDKLVQGDVTLLSAKASPEQGSVPVYGYQLESQLAITNNGLITSRELNVQAIDSGSSIYGDPLKPGTARFENLVETDRVVAQVTVDVSGKPIAGTYTQSASALDGHHAANYFLRPFSTENENYEITKRQLIIDEVTGESREYGQSIKQGSVMISNLVPGDDVTAIASVAFAPSDMSSSNNLRHGTYFQLATSITGEDSGNYSFTPYTTPNANYSVTRRPLSVVAIDSTVSTYGAPMVSGRTVFDGLLDNDSVQAVTSIVDPLFSSSGNLRVGDYRQMASTISGIDAPNYSLTPFTTANPNHTVEPKTLSISAIDESRSVYGATIVPGRAVFDGLLDNDSVQAVTSIVDPLFSSSGNLRVGDYRQMASTISGTDSGNYSLSSFTSTRPNYSVNTRELSVLSIADVQTRYATRKQAGDLGFANLASGDDVTARVAVASPIFSSSGNLAVGSYHQTTVNIEGRDAVNYTLAPYKTPNANYVVSFSAPLVITPEGLVGIVSGDDVEVDTSAASSDGYRLKGRDAANYTFSGSTIPIAKGKDKAPETNPFCGACQPSLMPALPQATERQVQFLVLSDSAIPLAGTMVAEPSPPTNTSKDAPTATNLSTDQAQEVYDDSEQRASEMVSDEFSLTVGNNIATTPQHLQFLLQDAAARIRRMAPSGNTPSAR